MTSKLTITRERLEELASGQSGFNLRIATLEESQQLARMALAAMDSEPVAYRWNYGGTTIWRLLDTKPVPGSNPKCPRVIEPLYRHAQPATQPAPVVPDDVLDALQKVARIRLDMNDFDGDRRGIADCLGDAEEALIEVVNRRAAMLAAAPQEVNHG